MVYLALVSGVLRVCYLLPEARRCSEPLFIPSILELFRVLFFFLFFQNIVHHEFTIAYSILLIDVSFLCEY